MTTLPVGWLTTRPRSLARLPARALALLLGGWGTLGCMEGALIAPVAKGIGVRTDGEVHGPR